RRGVVTRDRPRSRPRGAARNDSRISARHVALARRRPLGAPRRGRGRRLRPRQGALRRQEGIARPGAGPLMAARGSVFSCLLFGLVVYGGGAYAVVKYDLWQLAGTPLTLTPMRSEERRVGKWFRG